MNADGKGKLYIVGTPIGNLGDMSVRALDVLRSADFIAAEDTRVTMKLLTHFGISKPLVSYYEHNMRQRGGEIISRILSGETCALTTDAGMPAISDPGGLLVAQCRQFGVATEVVPGPCALIAAFALAGLESGRFCFEGFLSMNKRARREHSAQRRCRDRGGLMKSLSCKNYVGSVNCRRHNRAVACYTSYNFIHIYVITPVSLIFFAAKIIRCSLSLGLLNPISP